ncbi:hypothetical protein L484_020257 [Morus notabilis]|uniref:Uncharacterized protein n=1 Tax=Morus notabilis TaxID=981085 RepID=W9SBU4_9ROSA|nr:hypothetical protein L484_020257 [Morus notabilis]
MDRKNLESNACTLTCRNLFIKACEAIALRRSHPRTGRIRLIWKTVRLFHNHLGLLECRKVCISQ